MYSFRPSLWAVMLLGVALLCGCSDASSPTGPDSSDQDPSDSDDDEPVPEFNSQAAPGDSARAFLDDRQFTVLSVEIDFMEGYEPMEAALDSLKTALDAHVSKSSIRIRTPSSIPAQGQSAYSTEDIRGLEDDHRDHFTRAESDTLWAYFLVLDGKFADEQVVGIAYYNTSMAFFGKTIEEISGGVSQPSRKKVEGTVFRHEFGHNLGLVNNGIPTQQDHHDDANGSHCTDEQCVMYHTVETTDFFSNVIEGSIPDFGQFCTDDMAAQNGR